MAKQKKKWKKPQLIIFTSIPISERAFLTGCSGGGTPGGIGSCAFSSPACSSCAGGS